MKKTFFTIFLSLVVAGAAVAAWGVVSFKGNAVVQERELFVGRDVTYEQLMDSLKPSLKHHLAFDLYLTVKSAYDSSGNSSAKSSKRVSDCDGCVTYTGC